jgi:hypothetical protein
MAAPSITGALSSAAEDSGEMQRSWSGDGLTLWLGSIVLVEFGKDIAYNIQANFREELAGFCVNS